MVLINTIEDLDNIRHSLLGNYQLARNLDFNDDDSYANPANKPTYTTGNGWLPIADFTGSLDGNNKTIDNLFINRAGESGVGLFKSTEASASIINLGLLNVDITGNEGVAGLIGMNQGFITSCYVTGNITGGDFTGGLAGITQYGDVSKCYVIAQVIGSMYSGGLVGANVWGLLSQCFSKGYINGLYYVGGLVGMHLQTGIVNCYSHMEVTGVYLVAGLVAENNWTPCLIEKCYSMGKVTSMVSPGGLVALNMGYVHNSFWDIETSEQPFSDGGEGKTTLEMKDINTFKDKWWNIAEEESYNNEIWIIGDSYPYFGWMYTPPVIDSYREIDSELKNTNVLKSHKEVIPENSLGINKESLTSNKEKITFDSIAKQKENLISKSGNFDEWVNHEGFCIPFCFPLCFNFRKMYIAVKSASKNKKKINSNYEEL